MIGTVYKIEVGEDIYIGSTISKLYIRQREHNNCLKRYVRKSKLYEECRKNNIIKIISIPLQQIEIENIEEIRLLEQEYMDKLQPSLNHNSSYTGLTPQEYKKQKNKEWRDNNTEYKRQINKEWRDNNREKLKEYYKTNKAELNKKHTEKITCPICNSNVGKGDIKRHQRTKKCLSHIV